MARKGENIYKRKDGRWEGRYPIGRNARGKTKYRSVYGKTYAEVREKLLPLKAKGYTYQESGRLTVGMLFEEWLSAVQLRVKPSTYANYRMKADKHILPEFGGIRYDKLTVQMLHAFIERKLQGGLSAKYVSDIVVVIKSMAKYASRVHGFRNLLRDVMLPKIPGTERKILSQKEQKTLCRHLHFEDPKVISTLKDIALKISRGLYTTIIIVSSITKIPKELEKFITLLDVEFPTQKEIRSQICRFVQEQGIPPIADKLLEEMSIALKGMTEFEVENILALAFTRDGNFTRQDLQLIFTQKKQVIIKSGILEMIQIKEKQDDIGGLEYLKKWLERKSRIYKSMNRAIEFGVDMPKGVLIAGLPGCASPFVQKQRRSCLRFRCFVLIWEKSWANMLANPRRTCVKPLRWQKRSLPVFSGLMSLRRHLLV